MLFDPADYPHQLAAKADHLRQLFAEFAVPELEIYPSAPSHFRMRAEFRIWHQGPRLFYAFFPHADKNRPELIDDFPTANQRINALMPQLLARIEPEPLLKERLFQIDFLTSQTGEALVSLLYHKKLGEGWLALANSLKQELGIQIIGRSRGQKLCLDRDFITEVLQVEQRSLRYRQIENSFTQPNAGVAEQMLNWACRVSRQLEGDLLELYCGNGNFSLALAPYFPKILATEIAKSSVDAAQHNLRDNGIETVRIVRLASEEMTQALHGTRPFRRLADIDLGSYQFQNLLVDPPRAGLDPATLQLAQEFDNILYISCNPQTLVDNLNRLGPDYQIRAWALFDQFPYTEHIETGVWLQRSR